MYICQCCKQEFKNTASLHGHVSRAHKIKVKDYYYRYIPRVDLFDGKLIEFKNLSQYMNSSFNSRSNFLEWLKKSSKEEALSFLKNFLIFRKYNKNIKYLPSHVELKSLICPSFHSIVKILPSESLIENFANDLGLIKKYNYFDELNLSTPTNKLNIIIDSREQLPLNFKNSDTSVMKLISGDYTVKNPDIYSDVYIERKSINDLYGTMGIGFDRFCRELERASQLNHYIIVLVESSFSEANDYSPYYSKNKFNLMSSVRKICQQFDNCQFVFGATRTECSRLVESIFLLKNQVRNIDIEYFKDKKLI